MRQAPLPPPSPQSRQSYIPHPAFGPHFGRPVLFIRYCSSTHSLRSVFHRDAFLQPSLSDHNSEVQLQPLRWSPLYPVRLRHPLRPLAIPPLSAPMTRIRAYTHTRQPSGLLDVPLDAPLRTYLNYTPNYPRDTAPTINTVSGGHKRNPNEEKYQMCISRGPHLHTFLASASPSSSRVVALLYQVPSGSFRPSSFCFPAPSVSSSQHLSISAALTASSVPRCVFCINYFRLLIIGLVNVLCS